jgi:hypothetical protein
LGGILLDFNKILKNPENPEKIRYFEKFWVRIVKDWRREMNTGSSVYLKPNIITIFSKHESCLVYTLFIDEDDNEEDEEALRNRGDEMRWESRTGLKLQL